MSAFAPSSVGAIKGVWKAQPSALRLEKPRHPGTPDDVRDAARTNAGTVAPQMQPLRACQTETEAMLRFGTDRASARCSRRR
jgi:hypothetical protein